MGDRRHRRSGRRVGGDRCACEHFRRAPFRARFVADTARRGDGTALPALASDGPDPAVGTMAPTLVGSAFDGSPVAVKPGRPTLVIFLAHWCPHCQREVPVLTQWQKSGGVPDGVDVIGVATGTDTSAPNYPPSQWLTNEQFPFPVMADSDTFAAATAFGLPSYPYFVVLDANGKVVLRTTGEIDPNSLTPVLNSLVVSMNTLTRSARRGPPRWPRPRR